MRLTALSEYCGVPGRLEREDIDAVRVAVDTEVTPQRETSRPRDPELARHVRWGQMELLLQVYCRTAAAGALSSET